MAGRKRSYGIDENVEAEMQRKRSNPGTDDVSFKMLVPSIAAGYVIGKRGETISQIQSDTGATTKLSKPKEFYPGTSERVLLITGAKKQVQSVAEIVSSKIREREDRGDYDRHKQVKILVPNTTAGMIIGKGGQFIKQIMEDSGSKLKISKKVPELQERCVEIMGEENHNNVALETVVDVIASDPESGRFQNVTYDTPSGNDFSNQRQDSFNTGGMGGPGMSGMNNRMGGMQNMGNARSGMQGGFNMGTNQGASMSSGMSSMQFNSGANSLGGLANMALDQPMKSDTMTRGSTGMTQPGLQNIRQMLLGNGYSDQAVSEISQAVVTLCNYNLLGVFGLGLGGMGMGAFSSSGKTGLGSLGTGGSLGLGGMSSELGSGLGMGSSSGLGSGLGMGSSTGFGSSLSGTGNMENIGSMGGSNIGGMGDSFASRMGSGMDSGMQQGSSSMFDDQYNNADGSGDTEKQLEVNDNIVGAIFGQGGKGLFELKDFTGANIHVSKKGVYAPGTHRDRIVTITGNPQSVKRAEFLIKQRLEQEEAKRARQAFR